jgi:Ala-tRNA(Pro) deacylase
MSTKVFERLEKQLRASGTPFDVLRHEPVFTSDEAARVRGTTLASGAKALICKADEKFVMFVMPADRRLDSKLARKQCGIRSLRFATAEEVLELTGLKPGSIPPFGSLFQLATWCDAMLSEQPRINFNAGDHSISIGMTFADYAAAESPTVANFTSSS